MSGQLTLIGSRLFLLVHARKSVCNLLEKGLDVVASLSRRLDEHDVEFFGALLSFFRRNLSTIASTWRLSLGTRFKGGKRKETDRLSFRSVLLPTRTMMTSLPLSERTSSTHLLVLTKLALSADGHLGVSCE